MADMEFTQICKEILGIGKKLEKIEPDELRKIKTDIERISEAVAADKTLFDTDKKDFDGKYNKIAEIIKTFDTLKAQIEEVLKSGTINDSAEALISTFSSKKIMDLLNEAKRVINEKFSTIFLKTTGNQTLDGILETTNAVRALTTKNSTDGASYAGASFEARGQGNLNPAVAFHSPNRFAFTLEAEGSSNLVIFNQDRSAVGTLRANLNGTATNSQKLDGLEASSFVKKEDTLVKLLPAGDYNSWDFWQSIPDGTYWHIETVGSNPPTAWAFVEVVSYRTEKDVIWRIGGEVSILHMNHVKAPVKWDRLIMEREFQCSKAQNGYTKLPNGLILQWGSITEGVAGERAFPIAFPNIVLVVIAGNTNAQGSAVDNAFAYAISKEKFYYGTKASHGSTVGCFSGSYIAIGY
jgi:hypothetical protein|nr:MAG TPA: putative tail fiber protein [Caudoviricetes sp.]